MPKLGESVTEGTVGKWLKQVGDSVYKYEPLAEVTTDKVTAEIPSDFDGVLTAILVGENETVKVGAPLAVIAEAGADPAVSASAPRAQTEGSPDGQTAVSARSGPAVAESGQRSATADRQPAAASANSVARPAPDSAEPPAPAPGAQRARYSPVVMRMAQERGVDIARIKGSGIAGRVTRKDVLAYIPGADGLVTPAAQSPDDGPDPHAAPTAGLPAASVGGGASASVAPGEAPASEDWVPVTAVRRTIAQRMVQSKQQAPHAWMMVEVDVTPLVRLREREKRAFRQREGIDLTYLPFFIKAAVESLKEFPMVNSSWAEDKIIVKRDLHISIAVATENALVVPVIKHADRLSVSGLAMAVSDLAQRARSGKLTVDDMQGGTFTVNNTGAFGSILSQPIINAPQAAILSVESIVRRPVVRGDDSISIRSMVNLCMSLDHRVLDGWVAGQFLRTVKLRLERMDEQTSLH
ncbi:MAG: dihydrolipoamide acetyltransferase family protein [Acidimicrobiales bacterium]